MKRTALISVTAKQSPDIADFVRQLQQAGSWSIISSGGTCKYLRDAGLEVADIADVIAASVVQQFINAGIHFVPIENDGPLKLLSTRKAAEMIKAKPIFGHRVVTLAREKSAMLLARFAVEDEAELKTLGLSHIDMVVCDFYALKKAIEAAGATMESVIEATDIGGPTMVSEGAKGRRIVICDPADRQLVIDEMRANNGDITEQTRNDLCAKADGVVARYRLESARYHSKGAWDGIVGQRAWNLAYGENRDQSPAAVYSDGSNDPLGWDKFQVIAGDPGFVNIADGDAALATLCLLGEACQRAYGRKPNIAIACKHGNPSGLGVDWNDPAIALRKAMLGDGDAVMGAEVITNFRVSAKEAIEVHSVPRNLRQRVGRPLWGADVVFAPSFDEQAESLLSAKDGRRLLVNPALGSTMMPPEEWVFRPVRGGFIRQKQPSFVLTFPDDLTGVDSQARMNMLIAWAVAWRATSNTVAFAKDNMLVALGCGQRDRRACVKLALDLAATARHDLFGAMFASDAFWPFASRQNESDPLEGPELVIQAGCAGGVVPADGMRLNEVQKLFADKGLKVVYVPKQHRGFARH